MKNEKELIYKMSLEEKVSLLSGKSMWETKDINRLGIPSIVLSDGPHGVRRQLGSGDHLGLNQSRPATCFPTAATIANSWDEELGEVVGEFIGEEAFIQNVDVLLGPGLNIKRSPLCGRNFEYFSEDPYLSGKMAAAYVRGIQKKGVFACPKHFAVNNQEFRRMASDSIIDERTLREIYLTAFEIVVKEADPKCIMTSYNKVNGIYASENKKLLHDILVKEWGFKGFVVTDWGGSNNHVESVRSGNHLEMPSTGGDSDRELVSAVQNGIISEKIIDKRVEEFINVIKEKSMPNENNVKEAFDIEKHNLIAQMAAEQSIILLKNNEGLLPLSHNTRVGIVGDFAFTPRYQGAGSSIVNCTKLESTVDVAKQSGLRIVGCEKGYQRNEERNHKLEKAAVSLVQKADVILIYLGLDEISESEGLDRDHMKIPDNQISLLDELSKVNNNIVVIISAGSAIEMPWVDKCKAILHGYLGGQAGAKAMLRCITGDVCPSGKLSETLAMEYEDVPSKNYFLAEGNDAEYREGVFVGYRYYDTANIQVRYPFGYGLSYTTFVYSNLNIGENGVTFTINNIGDIDGAEVSQLYVHSKKSDIYRPEKELKGFKKVFLKAGEEKEVHIELDDKAFRYFNTGLNNWDVEDGEYEISIGASSRDIRLVESIYVKGSKVKLWYDKAKLTSYYSGDITSVTDKEFEHISGRKLIKLTSNKQGLLDINDTFSQMYYAKSILARFVYRLLLGLMRRSEKKGVPNLNVLFVFNMPFRGIAKLTNGIVTMDMANHIVEIVNGHFFVGMNKLIKSYFRNKKIRRLSDRE